jgi:hypothetical protein
LHEGCPPETCRRAGVRSMSRPGPDKFKSVPELLVLIRSTTL